MLVIPASRFVMHFFSDGSNNDWGYKMTITPTLASPSRPLVLESSHPYPDNTDEYRVVEIPGAVSYRISFDSQSSTEMNHDFVR